MFRCKGLQEYENQFKSREKVRISRRLLLFNLKEAHFVFQQQRPEIKVLGIIKIVFSSSGMGAYTVDSSGAHNVCLCIYHKNPKLMIKGDGIIENYKILFS